MVVVSHACLDDFSLWACEQHVPSVALLTLNHLKAPRLGEH
jgi:hypothetical protein